MPEQWMRDLMGEEERPRRGFEDELAAELERGWRSDAAAPSPWREVLLVAAAVALVITGVAVLTGRGDDTTVTPGTSVAGPTSPDESTPTSVDTQETTSVVAPTPLPTTTDPVLPDGAARPVKEYAVALANGDWMAAAKLLGEGGEDWTTRADLRPLYRNEFDLRRDDGSLEGLAAALARWCTRAACAGSIESINDEGDAWFSVATSGQGNVSLYRVITFEGQAGVRGLPLQLRTDTPNADTDHTSTLCPTDQPIERTAWADLDGDGWLELLVAQRVADAVGESGIADYRIVVCGTSSAAPPIQVSGDGLSLSVVPAFADTPETVLVGFTEGYLNGIVYQAINGVLVGRQGTDGVPYTFAVHPEIQGQQGESVGCERFDGVDTLVRYTYRTDGDVLTYGYSPLVGPITFEADESAPFESEDAVRVQTGVCNGLPVITN